jgi:hypothetical protein
MRCGGRVDDLSGEASKHLSDLAATTSDDGLLTFAAGPPIRADGPLAHIYPEDLQ